MSVAYLDDDGVEELAEDDGSGVAVVFQQVGGELAEVTVLT